ncbi:SLA1 [Candida margitis]|uniref:SLA1 n=1 Tax=Candida margitis TaxID=1775924 RepID=UPI0022263E0B|nr:SLA1 [Candida margitis]KAI5969990.1 SLA1 [Candida margitis]
MTIKQKVLFLEVPNREVLERFEQLFECIYYELTTIEQCIIDFQGRLKNVEGIYCGWAGFAPVGGFRGKLVDFAPRNLKIITTCSIGYDHFDVQALTRKNIILTNSPSTMAYDAVADLVLYNTIASFRNFKIYESNFGKERYSQTGILTNSLISGKFDQGHGVAVTTPVRGIAYGKSCCGRSNLSPRNHHVVIVGFGHIGQAIAARLSSIGMIIHYVKRNKLSEKEERKLGFPITFHQSLSDTTSFADLVVIACPGTPSTQHMVNSDMINSMVKQFRIINVGRGFVIDESALVRGLKSGKVLFAGLDVFEEEPHVHPALLDRQDVVLTPHIGSASTENYNYTAVACLENIEAVLFNFDKTVTRALYDYDAQAEEELSIHTEDLLYLLEKSDIDDWWKVKKRVIATGDEVVDEPSGLVPSTYIEEAPVIKQATALYDYDKQTEEELSFNENDVFNVYDLSDPDWILVSNSGKQEFGFVPSNYIQLDTAAVATQQPQKPQQQSQQENLSYQPPQAQSYPTSQPQIPIPNFPPPPSHFQESATSEHPPPTPEKDIARPFPSQHDSYNRIEDNYEEEEAPPPMPSRPTGPASDPVAGSSSNYEEEQEVHTSTDTEHKFDGEFFTWYIDELDGRKKRPIKVSVGQGLIIIKPNTFNPKKLRLRSASHINNQWEIKDLTSVSSEKKHVFLELQNPPASLELHAGTKDVADAITSILGELKGAEKAAGLKEVQRASQPSTGGSNKKVGRLIYNFRAQGDDELNCREGDEVYIVNQSKSADWWMVENITTGRQGVVPSSYIEVVSTSRLDELTDGPARRKSMSSSKGKVVNGRESRHQHHRTRDERERVREKDRAHREKQSSGHDEHDKSMPNFHRVRTWIDSSGTFKVEAEFLGCVEGKVHLHKTNGVKIAVAAEKLSIEDLEYVEKITGTSLENYKQMVQKQLEKKARSKSKSGAVSAQPEAKSRQSATAAINASDAPPPQPSRPRPSGHDSNGAPAYDWFDFFLECGVDVGNCQRYTLNFEREQMDENILEDISPSLLRTLGLREGDIIRVMKYLDNKYNRKRSVEPEQQSTGSLFIDNNGALKNNSSTELSKVTRDALPSPVKTQQSTLEVPSTQPQQNAKIDDDAWAMKPAARSNENLLKPSPQPQTPQYTGSLSDLVNIKPVENKSESQQVQQAPSAPPLQPTKTSSIPPLQPTKTAGTTDAQNSGGVLVPAQRTGGFIPIQRTGAGVSAMPTGGLLPAQPTGFIPITSQPTGFIPIQATGILQPQLTFGLVALPTGQKTGGGQAPPTTFGQSQSFQPNFVPLQTGTASVPQTSFGTQNTGGLPSTTFGTQNTGGLPSTSFNQNPLVPAQRTGGQITGGFIPQSNFGKQITGGFMNTNTAPFGQQQPTGGVMPQTSFGQQQTGGMMPQTSFGNQITGGQMPQSSFGQPAGGIFPNSFGQSNGSLPSTSFGQASFSQPLQNTFQQQQPFNQFTQQPTQFNQFNQQPQQQQPQQPNMNQMTNMFQNTSISQPFNQQGAFGNSQFEGFNSQPLQTQPTGMGFGNAPLQSQATGKRANLAAATPDNPFGF